VTDARHHACRTSAYHPDKCDYILGNAA
jgi:hypothetical protein